MDYAKGLFSNITNFLTIDEADRHRHLSMIVNGVIDTEDKTAVINELDQMESMAYTRCLEIAVNHLIVESDLTDSDDLNELIETVQEKILNPVKYVVAKKKRSAFELKLFKNKG